VRLLFYHHANPQRHRICTDFRTYPWTSYRRYLLDLPSKLPKEEVFGLFGSREKFIEYHEQLKNELDEEADWFIED